MSLPHGYDERKALPLYSFLTGYFPDAIIELVKVSVEGNNQHNPGEPLHWSRGKSTDQLNTAMRHIFDHGGGARYDVDGTMHLAKAAWRLLAEIQLICEKGHKAVNSVDLPKEVTSGQINISTAQSDTFKGLCPSFNSEQVRWPGWISDTGRKPRPERPFPSQPERDFSPEIDGPGKGSC